MIDLHRLGGVRCHLMLREAIILVCSSIRKETLDWT
jgi:hypothetical protein